MSDEANLFNDNVRPIGRGQFFTVDRRTWAKACDLSINAAIAYLVMARGTGPDMKTTSWSAKAMEERTSVPWRQCRDAVQAIVASGLVRRDKAGQHPRYTILPAHEVSGCVPGGKQPELSGEEHRLVDKIGDGRRWVPKVGRWEGEQWEAVGPRPYEIAQALVRRGGLVEVEPQSFTLAVAEVDERPDWIWLPNAIADGAAGETPPIELLRQSANRAALRLFVDLYHAQSLNDFGGVHWRQLRQDFERHRVGEHGSFVVWGFRGTNRTTWHDAPFVLPHLTGTKETFKTDQGVGTRDTGIPGFWAALEVLTSTGLVEMVGHVVNTDTDEGTILHPYAIRNGESGEQAIAHAAHRAGLAMLNEAKSADATARGLWLLPAKRHMADVQLVGLARLRYRARTKVTASWLSGAGEWSEWTARYEATERETRELASVDINGASTLYQR